MWAFRIDLASSFKNLTDGFGGNDLVIFASFSFSLPSVCNRGLKKRFKTHYSVEVTYILPADVEVSSNTNIAIIQRFYKNCKQTKKENSKKPFFEN